MSQYIGAVPESAKMEVIRVDQRQPRQNMLMNSDFVINQRGYSNGSSLAYYSFSRDRWFNANGSASESFTFDGAGKCTMTNGALLGQRVELTDSYKAGDVLTLSWVGTAYGRVGSVGSYTNKVSYYLTSTDISNGYVLVFFGDNGTWVSEPKLELGASPTIWEPPDPAIELTRCYRHFYKTYNMIHAPGTATNIGRCVDSLATSGTISITPRLPVHMYKTPTILAYDSAGNSGAVTTNVGDNQGYTLSDVGTMGFRIAKAGVTSLSFQFTASGEV